MEASAEEIVTKLLTSREVLKVDNKALVTNPMCDLGKYLKDYKPEPSRYEGKYLFIR